MATRKVLGTGLDLNGQKIVGLADGSSATDAVTKQQLDAASLGMDWKASVRAATTANITLSGAQTIDGVSVIAGDRVLVKAQTTGSANGLYVAASGSWTRSTDANTSAKVTSGLAVTVEEGTTNQNTLWQLTTDAPITLDTTALVFSPLGGNTYTAGSGLSLTSGAFAVNAGSGIIADGTSTRIDSAYSGLAKRYSANVGDGSSTAITVTHNLATRDVTVTLYDATSFDEVIVDVNHATTNTVVLTFATAPASSAYRVTIVG